MNCLLVGSLNLFQKLRYGEKKHTPQILLEMTGGAKYNAA